MKKQRLKFSIFNFQLSIFLVLLLASCSEDVQTDQFSSTNGNIVATRTIKGADTTWTINDANGVPLVADCDSIKVIASYPTSQPKEAIFHHKGQQTLISFYENMERWIEGDLKNDLREGLWIGYDQLTGKKMSETYYTNGVENGPYKTFYKNGEPFIVGQYSNGKKVGKWSIYDEYGVLEATEDHDN